MKKGTPAGKYDSDIPKNVSYTKSEIRKMRYQAKSKAIAKAKK